MAELPHETVPYLNEGSMILTLDDLPKNEGPHGLAITGPVDMVLSEATIEELRAEDARAARSMQAYHRRTGRSILDW
jgi:hypothetical protein